MQNRAGGQQGEQQPQAASVATVPATMDEPAHIEVRTKSSGDGDGDAATLAAASAVPTGDLEDPVPVEGESDHAAAALEDYQAKYNEQAEAGAMAPSDGDGLECVDKNDACAQWAAGGECTANPGYSSPDLFHSPCFNLLAPNSRSSKRTWHRQRSTSWRPSTFTYAPSRHHHVQGEGGT